MELIRLAFGITALVLAVILLVQMVGFKQEFKKAIKDDRSLSRNFLKRWNRKSALGLPIGIAAFILGIITIFLS